MEMFLGMRRGRIYEYFRGEPGGLRSDSRGFKKPSSISGVFQVASGALQWTSRRFQENSEGSHRVSGSTGTP